MHVMPGYFGPSTPYRRSEAVRGGVIEVSCDIHEHRGFACYLGYREGYMTHRSGFPAIMVWNRRGVQAAHSSKLSPS